MRLGFVGLGQMGLPMSLNCLRAGFDLTFYNRSSIKTKAATQAGGIPVNSLAEVAQSADVIMTCLPSVAASEEVFLGDKGIIENCRRGQILLDHSTIGPVTARKIATAATERGAHFLDAPISGGVERAQDATLTVMVGGDEAAFRQVEPVLRAVGQNIHLMGNVGAGCVVKLVNQFLTNVHAVAAAEAMVLGVTWGADPEVLFKVLETSWGQSRMLERLVPRFLNRDFSPRAPIRLLRKDLDLIQGLIKERPITSLMRPVEKLFDRARSEGIEESDLAALVLLLERQAGVEVVGQKS